jgi:hypothetical protein
MAPMLMMIVIVTSTDVIAIFLVLILHIPT